MVEDTGPGPVADYLPHVVAVPVPAGTADTLLVSGGCFFNGYSFLGNGVAAVIELYDGQDATGTLLAVVSLASGATDHMGPASKAVFCRNGLFMHRVSGNSKGAAYVQLFP